MSNVRPATLRPGVIVPKNKSIRRTSFVNGACGRLFARRVVRAEYDASHQESDGKLSTFDSVDISYSDYSSVQNPPVSDVLTNVDEVFSDNNLNLSTAMQDEETYLLQSLETEDAGMDQDQHALEETSSDVPIVPMRTPKEVEQAIRRLEASWAVETIEPTDKKHSWDTLFDKISPKTKSVLLLNLGAFLFGSNQAVIKSAEGAMSPSILSFVRFAIAASVFTPRIIRGLQNENLRNASMELGFWLFGGYTMQILGLSMTSASHGALTGTFTVLIVPMLVGLTGRKIPPVIWASAFVAIAGMALLTSGDGNLNYGDGLCVLSAFLFGVHKFRTETVTAKFESTDDLMAVQLFVLSILSLVAAVPEITGYLSESGFDMNNALSLASSVPWIPCAYMGLATTALTLWIECKALKDVSAPLAALIYSSEPLWGALVAMLCLGERFDTRGYIGGALIVASSLGAQLVGDGKSSSKEKSS